MTHAITTAPTTGPTTVYAANFYAGLTTRNAGVVTPELQ